MTNTESELRTKSEFYKQDGRFIAEIKLILSMKNNSNLQKTFLKTWEEEDLY